MDKKKAERLFREGGIFILMDYPAGTIFGIDFTWYSTYSICGGVKMIPQGPHYIYVQTGGDTAQKRAPRIGFFHNFYTGEVLVKQWSQLDKEVSLVELPGAATAEFKENILLVDEYLKPYPYDLEARWANLTSHFTENLILKLQPESGLIRSTFDWVSRINQDQVKLDGSNVESSPSTSKSDGESCSEETEDSLLPKLEPKAGTGLRPTKLPGKNYPEICTAGEITQHSLDSSCTLGQMIQSYENAADILGEIEFMYICFRVGHSSEGFDQWKKLVSSLCSCDVAVKKYRYIYNLFISLLELQLKEIEEEYLTNIVGNNSSVHTSLRLLFRSIASIDVDGRLKSKALRFKTQLTDTYLWDFSHLESDEEDEAPIIKN